MNRRYERIMSSARIRNLYSEYIRGKRVVFVGPSVVMKDRGLGEYIDSFDIVVRTNNFPVIIDNNHSLWRDVGKRTDILYSNHQYYRKMSSLPLSLYKKIGLKWVCLKRCNPTDYRKISRVCRARLFSREMRIIARQISIPLTGSVLVYDLLQFNPKELHITGIAFYKNIERGIIRGDNPKTYESYIDPNYIIDIIKEENEKKGYGEGIGHDMYDNAQYLKNLYNDGRITMPDFVVDRINEVLYG